MGKFSWKNVLISCSLWIVFVFFVNNLERLLLVSIFLTIPILLTLIPTNKRDNISSNYHALLSKFHLYAAIPMGIALLFPSRGEISGILSIPWTFYTLALAGYGIRRFLERGWYIIEENAVDTGLVYALFGGITLSIYCFTNDAIIRHSLLMMTVYFHFLAIYSPVFIGLVGRILPIDQKLGNWYRYAVRGTMISPLLIGMFTNLLIENIAIWVYTVCIFIYGYFVFVHIKGTTLITRICLQLSTVVILVTNILAVIGSIEGHSWLNSNQVILYQVIPNVIGFVAIGIIGWYLVKPKEQISLYNIPHTGINGGNKIGRKFLEQNGYTDNKTFYAGIVDNLEKFGRNDFFPTALHPKVRSFFENTTLYDVTIQVNWSPFAWLFERMCKHWTNKMQQTNLPSFGEGAKPINSEIVSVNNKEQYWNKNLRAWICDYKDSDETLFVAIYSHHKKDNEPYLHVTYPITKTNRISILRLEHGMDGALQLTSIPRRGGKGDEGNYLIINNFSMRIPFNEHILLWVDEYGRLQITQRFWFFGVRIMSLEYEINGK